MSSLFLACLSCISNDNLTLFADLALLGMTTWVGVTTFNQNNEPVRYEPIPAFSVRPQLPTAYDFDFVEQLANPPKYRTSFMRPRHTQIFSTPLLIASGAGSVSLLWNSLANVGRLVMIASLLWVALLLQG